MCGICGVLLVDRTKPVDHEALAAMTAAMSHRGPDDSSLWRGPGVAFGHRRLSIVDLAGGSQPMSNETGSVSVVFNGEIYNHQELRAELEAQGHRFRTRCDTEVLVHLYEELGSELVQRLSGMFAFALWDAEREVLLLARDRLGIKPLYYHRWDGGLVFASDLPALVRWPAVPRTIDPRSLHLYLQHEFVPSPGTILAGVSKLRPAEILEIDRRGAGRPRIYWRCRFEPKSSLSADEACEAFDEALERSVRRRLMADVPLGAFLSGGIDSSSVVYWLRRLVSGPLRTFSIGFDDPSYDELPYAREVARRFETEHFEEVVRLDATTVLDDVVRHLDEPLGDASTLPTLLVSRLARRHVKVCLSGDGGDELFAGYERHLASRLARALYDPLPRLIREKILVPAAARLPVSDAKKGASDLARRLIEGAAKDPRGAQLRWQTFLPTVWLDRLYTPAMQELAAATDPWEAVAEKLSYEAPEGRLDRELALELGLYLPDDILTKLDSMSMATSLEARVPFLDHELVELVAKMPERFKMRFGRGKWLLRRSMRGRLPAAVLGRRKQGFSMPVKRWLRGELHDRAADLFRSRGVRESGLLEPEGLTAMLASHRSRAGDFSHQLWSLFVLVAWLGSLGSPSSTGTEP